MNLSKFLQRFLCFPYVFGKAMWLNFSSSSIFVSKAFNQSIVALCCMVNSVPSKSEIIRFISARCFLSNKSGGLLTTTCIWRPNVKFIINFPFRLNLSLLEMFQFKISACKHWFTPSFPIGLYIRFWSFIIKNTFCPKRFVDQLVEVI